MFTGLVEEIGRVEELRSGENSIQIKIRADKVLENAKIGDSIATNGVCLTVVELSDTYFVADCMHETIRRSNLKSLSIGSYVNLEKSVTLNTFLGGHIVLGDVDTTSKITEITEDGIAKIYAFELEEKYLKYVVEKGRITIDGASLTVMNVNLEKNLVYVSLIPHTQEKITLGSKKVGDKINIETDIFAKYVENILKFENKKDENKTEITEEFLLRNGF